MSQPGLIGAGMPPRDNDVERMLRDMQRQIDALHASANLQQRVIVAGSPNNVGETWTGSWDIHATATVTVPKGFTSVVVTGFAQAGTSATGAVSLGVQMTWTSTTTTGVLISAANPAISSAVNALPLSVTTFGALTASGLVGGDTLTVQAFAYRNGPATALSDNAHVAAQFTFGRF